MTERNVWFVRHGYRQDYTDPQWKQTAQYPRDTPLSNTGMQQAQDLVARLGHANIQHIFVSPYLRTLQTVDPLSMAKGSDISLNVEPGFGEIVSERNISALSLTDPERQTRFPQINQDYESIWQPIMTETSQDAMTRASLVLAKILVNYSGNLLIVSHESPIRGMVKSLTHPKQKVRCSFCGVTELTLANNQWHLKSNGDVSHLSTPTRWSTFFMDYCRRRGWQG